MKEYNYLKGIFLVLLLCAFILFLEVLRVTASFSLPICISILISYIYFPFIKKLNSKFHIPWIIGVIAMMLITFTAIYILGNLLISSFTNVGTTFPKYEERFLSLYKTTAHIFNIKINEDDSVFLNLYYSLNLKNYIQTAALSLSNFVISTAKVMLLLILLTLFLLIEMKSFHNKIRNAFDSQDRAVKIIEIMDRIIREVTHYISIKFLISLFTGILVFLCTLIAGVDFPIIWGFLAFVLNFIPNFGSIFSWIITTGFTVMQYYPDWGRIAFIGIAVLVINFTLGSIIEPRWEGSDLGISPFFILISLSVWGYVWGFIGMILAVPLLVIIKIACENFDFLKPVAHLPGHGKNSQMNPSKESSESK